MSRRRTATIALAALVILVGLGAVIVLLSANGGGDTRGTQGVQPNPGASLTTPASTGFPATTGPSTPGATGTAGQQSGPVTGPSSPAPPPPGTNTCSIGESTLRWTPDRPLVEQFCVHVGGAIIVALPPMDAQEWEQPSSSDPQVAGVGPLGRDQDGVVHTTVTALRPGGVTISVTASPRGPSGTSRTDSSRQVWLLTINVVA